MSWNLNKVGSYRLSGILKKEAVEILREKLIEDIKEFYAQEEPRTFQDYEEYFKYRGQRIINEIINKRFGAEE